MESHSTWNRSRTTEIHVPLLIALAGSALLAAGGSSAQQPPPEAAPPAITADTFKPNTPGNPTGRPNPIAVPPGQEQAILPPRTPRYFQKIFHQFLQAPLPAEIFQQGGVPAVIPEYEVDPDASGRTASYQPLGPTTTAGNAFFQSLGNNGRTCVTCHLPPNAMSVSVENINARWIATTGNDPIFAPVDGADCPNKVAPSNGRAAHSMLLDRGLFRIFLAIPDNPEFTVTVLHDPTDSAATQPPFNKDGCNTDPTYAAPPDSNGNPVPTLSMYRRPRIAGNLMYVQTTRSDVDNGGAAPPAAGVVELSLANPNPATDPIQPSPPPNPVPPLNVDGVVIDPGTGRPVSGNIMWDGREPTFERQAFDATLGHAQAKNPPTDTQVAQMVQFELGIFNAQVWDAWAHQLNGKGALGGPIYLSDGMPGLPPQTAGATFPLFDDWASLPATADRAAQRASVARGEVIFETRTFAINGVAGLTNIGAVKAQQLGTCASCHNQVNTGNDSFVAAQHDIGIGGTSPAPGAPPVTGAPNTFPQPSTLLPIFELDCTASGKTTVYQGPKVVTNDPGLAMITGKCADIGRFTVPQLRGLAARAPYFSDGSAATLLDVVSFYNTRFSIGLSLQDEQDLVAFLRSL
jgi:cytochrome c peroxidase